MDIQIDSSVRGCDTDYEAHYKGKQRLFLRLTVCSCSLWYLGLKQLPGGALQQRHVAEAPGHLQLDPAGLVSVSFVKKSAMA